MTEQTQGKVTQLSPEEWKQLCLLNAAQLQNFLQSIPGNTESGASGLTDQVMSIIEFHTARGRTFLRAWQVSRPEMPQVNVAQPASQAASNGAAPKGKGGWPKGKRRTPKPKAVVQDISQ